MQSLSGIVQAVIATCQAEQDTLATGGRASNSCDLSATATDKPQALSSEQQQSPKSSQNNILHTAAASHHTVVIKGPTLPSRPLRPIDETVIGEVYGPIPEGEVGCRPAGDAKRDTWMTAAPKFLLAAFGQNVGVEATIDPRKKLLHEKEQARMAAEMEAHRAQRASATLTEIYHEKLAKGEQPDVNKWNVSQQEDPWGVSRYEQRTEVKPQQTKTPFKGGSLYNRAKDDESEDPWRRFDRERDLSIKPKLDANACHSLLERSKDSGERFGKSSYLSSFM